MLIVCFLFIFFPPNTFCTFMRFQDNRFYNKIIYIGYTYLQPIVYSFAFLERYVLHK